MAPDGRHLQPARFQAPHLFGVTSDQQGILTLLREAGD